MTPLPAEPAKGNTSTWKHDYAARVAVVRDAGPELSIEIRDLLRSRLLLAAMVIFVGNLALLVKHFFYVEFKVPFTVYFFGFHVFMTVAIGTIAVILYRLRAVLLLWLRVSELIIFGLPAVFLLIVQQFTMLTCCIEGYFEFPIGNWLILIFTYALFIPNTLQRASIVIGVLAVTPIALALATMLGHPELFAKATLNDMINFPLMLILSAVAGIFGVDTIGSLRREAFEARQLGQYRLLERIGIGGMGEVYLAEHQLLKRPCVVKLIRPDKAGDARALARFRREVQATAKLSHWNTVEIFDYGSTEDGTFYYVMEYLPGMSLKQLVERFGPMPAERVVHFLRQACDALREAHGVGLIHRDIKPANIFAARRGDVCDIAKLLDFGLVKEVDQQSIELTTDGGITGSPLFMSPEQAVGESDPDARSDIYSLGAVGYYLLAGRPPFDGSKPIRVLLAHANKPVTPPSEHQEGIPEDLEQVILRCLEKDPADRFPDAESLENALAVCESADRWTRQQRADWWDEHGLLEPANPPGDDDATEADPTE